LQEPPDGVQGRGQLLQLRRFGGADDVDQAEGELEVGGRAVESFGDVGERRMQPGHGEAALLGIQRLLQRPEVEEGRVGQHLCEALGIGDAAAVLGRGGAAAARCDRVGGVIGRAPDGLDLQPDPPVVAVVVDVAEGVAHILQGLVQAHLGGGQALVLPLLDIEGTQEKLRARVEGVAAEREAVQVIVEPVEADLDDAVHLGEGEIAAQLEPAPDRRSRLLEVHAHREDRGLPERGAAQVRARHLCTGDGARAHEGPEYLVDLVRGDLSDDLVEASAEVSVGTVGWSHGYTVVGGGRGSRRPGAGGHLSWSGDLLAIACAAQTGSASPTLLGKRGRSPFIGQTSARISASSEGCFSWKARAMTSPSAQGQKNPHWGPPRHPGPPPHYLPPPVPQSSGALAIIAFIGSLVAFFFGWVPFIGLGLGLIFLLLSVLAVLKPTLRGMAITGIVLSTLATLTSLVTTGIVVLGIIGANSPPSSAGASPAPSYTAEDFQETDERTLSTIARDPGAHAGETLIVYGHISQFDANTGP